MFFLAVAPGNVQNDHMPVYFSRDVAPILLNRCIACHGQNKFKGGYQWVSYDLLIQAGETPIEPGDTAES